MGCLGYTPPYRGRIFQAKYILQSKLAYIGSSELTHRNSILIFRPKKTITCWAQRGPYGAAGGVGGGRAGHPPAGAPHPGPPGSSRSPREGSAGRTPQEWGAQRSSQHAPRTGNAGKPAAAAIQPQYGRGFDGRQAGAASSRGGHKDFCRA